MVKLKLCAMSEKISDRIKPGVATGNDLQEIFRIAKANQFALPAVNVVGTDSVNAVLEAAKAVNSPVIIQFSNEEGFSLPVSLLRMIMK